MLRTLLTVFLPLLLPLAAYIVYVAYLRRRAEVTGRNDPPPWQQGPWPWLLVGGAVLAVAALVALRVSSGVPPGTKLEAPRLEDGVIVPSHVVE